MKKKFVCQLLALSMTAVMAVPQAGLPVFAASAANTLAVRSAQQLGVHVQDDVDAPAVLRPGREVGVVHGGRSPQERTVTRGAAVRDVLILVALAQDLHDLAVILGEVVLLAVGGGPGIQTVQGLADAGQRAVGSLEVTTLLELETVLLVHVLGALEQGVPVILNAVFLFDEFDAVAQDLRGVRVGSRLVVNHRHGRLEVRQADAAALTKAVDILKQRSEEQKGT